MKQRNKYIVMSVASIALATAGTVSTETVSSPGAFAAAMAAFGIGAAGAIIAAKGYTDCHLFGNEMINNYGRLYNVKRRYLGLEFDSAYADRIKRKAYGFHMERVKRGLLAGYPVEKVGIIGRAVQRAKDWMRDSNHES